MTRLPPNIIPSVLVPNATAFAARFRKLASAAPTVQLDCLDATFAPERSFFDPAAFVKLPTRPKIDLHLMVHDPVAVIETWQRVPELLRATFHLEAVGNAPAIASWIRHQGFETCIALSPETPVAKIRPLLPLIESVLILGVHPGKSGQKLLHGTAHKVAELHREAPKLTIAVDGGVNLDTIASLFHAGASRFIIGSAFDGAGSPEMIIEELQKACFE